MVPPLPAPVDDEPRVPRSRDEAVASLAEREQAMVAARMRREQRMLDSARRAPAESAPSVERQTAVGAPAAAPAAVRPGGSPAIAVQVIVYSEVPAQRMAFIEGRRFAEGDMIDGDTILERINEDGIVVRRGGVRYVVLSRKE